MKIDISKWEQFNIGELMEKPVNTGNILERDIIDGSGNVSYVTASSVNNGVKAHIDASGYKVYDGNCILVGGKTFILTYQADPFVSNDSHNFIMRLKGTHVKEDYLFLIAVIKAMYSQQYSWDDAVNATSLSKEDIFLPGDGNGHPDWNYIRQYIDKMTIKAKESLSAIKSILDDLDE